MNRIALASCIALVLAQQSALACAISEDKRIQLFTTFDSNKDSKLSREEYLAGEESRMGRKFTDEQSQELTKHFDNMDKSNSGSITIDQFQPSSLWRDCL